MIPEYVFKNVTHITPEFLNEKGIKGLVLDVDNTLTEHGSQHLRVDIQEWLDTMRENGIKLTIASNNLKERVEPFANSIGLDYRSFCCKPSPHGLAAIRRSWGFKRSEMALVGDQIFTDALAGVFYGITVLLVRPMAVDIKPTIRLKRKLETPFLAAYYRRGGKLL